MAILAPEMTSTAKLTEDAESRKRPRSVLPAPVPANGPGFPGGGGGYMKLSGFLAQAVVPPVHG